MPANINIWGKANVEEWDKVTKKAAEIRQKSAKDMAAMGAGMMVAGAVIVAGLNAAGDAAAGWGEKVIDVQRLTGLGAAESSKWAAILDRYGVSGKSAGMVIKSLSNAIVTHNKALTDVGIATQDANGANRTTTAVLADVATYYSTATDKATANALAAKVLGKGYMALLDPLSEGGAAIYRIGETARKAGLILSQDAIDACEAYNEALKDTTQASLGLEVQVGLMVLPIKMQLIQALSAVVGWFSQLSPGMKQFIVIGAAVSAGVLLLVGFLLTLGMVASAATTSAVALSVSFGGTAIGAVAAAYAVGGLSAAVTTLWAALGPLAIPLLSVAAGVGILASKYAELAPAAQDYAQRVKAGELDPPTGWEQFLAPISTAAYWIETWTSDAAGAGTVAGTLGAVMGDLATTTAEVAAETKGYTDELIYQVNYLTRSQTAEQTALQDKIALKAATKAVADAVHTYGKNSNEARLARLNLTEAEKKSKDSSKVARDSVRDAGAAAGAAAVQYDKLVRAVEKANARLRQTPHAAVRIPGTQILLAAGGIIRRATSAIVGEAGPEVVIPLNDRVRAMQLMLESGLSSLVAPSFAFAPAGGGSYGGGASSHSSRSVVIAEGAVQLSFPGGTSATVEEVKAIVRDGLKQLADQVARR